MEDANDSCFLEEDVVMENMNTSTSSQESLSPRADLSIQNQLERIAKISSACAQNPQFCVGSNISLDVLKTFLREYSSLLFCQLIEKMTIK
jgi:hypothetical protein